MSGMTGEAETESDWIREAVRLYQEPLALYAARLTGCPESARDAVQETFVRLCQQKREDVITYLREWLFSVCRSRALDARRKEHHMIALAEPDMRAGNITLEPPVAAERREANARIAAQLDGLPTNQQEVIRLKFQNDLSYKEIASVTGLSVSNVGFLIHTGLKTLREKMRDA